MTQARPPKHTEHPERLSTDKPATTREEKIDRQMEDSFPASDPPSYSGGNHVVGAPAERASPSPKADSPIASNAGKTNKDGKAARIKK
jgi:hypothetical protein